MPTIITEVRRMPAEERAELLRGFVGKTVQVYYTATGTLPQAETIIGRVLAVARSVTARGTHQLIVERPSGYASSISASMLIDVFEVPPR